MGPSNSPKASVASAPSNKLTTAALLVPLLLFSFDKWQQFGPQINFGNSFLSTPFSQPPRNNVTAIQNITFGAANKFEVMAAKYADACPRHTFQTKLFSVEPLIIYVENYTTKDEAEYLLRLAEPYYTESPVLGPEGRSYNAEVRKSASAMLPEDPVASCLSQRTADLQGFLPVENVEDVQLVKYDTSDHFRPHYDGHPGMMNQRISTLFGYLACDDGEGRKCVGGGTGFPYLDAYFPKIWCDRGFVDCEQSLSLGGVVFTPIVGNAVFWRNFYPNGTGVKESYHAGMPVEKGRKVGLNMWSRKEKYDGDVLAITDKNFLSESDKQRCAGKEVCYVVVD